MQKAQRRHCLGKYRGMHEKNWPERYEVGDADALQGGETVMGRSLADGGKELPVIQGKKGHLCF